MLNSLTLENFKAFQKLDKLQLKPITILCGTNSCGKSSIIQSLLLLNQSVFSQNLVLDGNLINLGHGDHLAYQRKKNTTIRIGLGLNKLAENDKDFISNVNIGFTFFDNKALKIQNIDLVVHLTYSERPENECSIKLNRINDTKWQINWEEIEIQGKTVGEAILDLDSRNILDFDIDPYKSFKVDRVKYLLDELEQFESLQIVLAMLAHTIKSTFKDFSYLGPLRSAPKHEYIYHGIPDKIDNQGENAAFFYFNERDTKINNHYFYNKNSDTFSTINNISLKDAVNKWLELMKIDNFNVETENRIIYVSQNASQNDTTKVGIADVGFGVSQIFPIVLEGLRLQKGSTLLLEQPEIHLHPNLQMQMADYFISLALSGKNIIAETHSDHIVNRLVRRIVEDGDNVMKNLIAIYFIKPSVNGAIYEEVEIDEMKGIINWPPDFFDQAANEQMLIMQAGLKKRQALTKKTKP
jgi:predicted ATPase